MNVNSQTAVAAAFIYYVNLINTTRLRVIGAAADDVVTERPLSCCSDYKKKKKQVVLNVNSINRWLTHIPVSYTHLDVYKRQT